MLAYFWSRSAQEELNLALFHSEPNSSSFQNRKTNCQLISHCSTPQSTEVNLVICYLDICDIKWNIFFIFQAVWLVLSWPRLFVVNHAAIWTPVSQQLLVYLLVLWLLLLVRISKIFDFRSNLKYFCFSVFFVLGRTCNLYKMTMPEENIIAKFFACIWVSTVEHSPRNLDSVSLIKRLTKSWHEGNLDWSYLIRGPQRQSLLDEVWT